MTRPTVVPVEVVHYLEHINPWGTTAEIAEWLGLSGTTSVTKVLNEHGHADLIRTLKRNEVARSPWGLVGTPYYRQEAS